MKENNPMEPTPDTSQRNQFGVRGLVRAFCRRLVAVEGGKASFVDLSGTDVRTGQQARIVGAIVPQTSQTWFYKLMGDPKIVEAQKDIFTKFVRTVKY